jgi:hypothetical protein
MHIDDENIYCKPHGCRKFKSNIAGRSQIMAENKMSEAALNIVRVVRDANQAIANNVVAAQERNVKYTQSVLINGLEVLKSQMDSNRNLAQQLLEMSQRQQEAWQTLAQESIDAYIDLLRAPYTSYKQAVEFAESASR